MTSISMRRKIIAVLLLPFLMVLAGCGKLHAEFDIKDVDTIDMYYDLAIDEEFASSSYDSADAMCSELTEEVSVTDEMAPSVEAYEENGQFGCRVNGVMTRENFASDFELTEEDGEFHLVISGDETADFSDPSMGELDIDFRMTFSFPGDIIEANGGEIDGSSVTYTDISVLAQGIDIRADAGGFPWVIVIVVVLVLGFLLLLLIAAVAFFVIRSRKNKGGGSTPVGVPVAYGAAGAAGAAAPQGQPWSQSSPPAAPLAQPGQQGQPWGQPSPAAPQGQPGQQGQPWGQPSPSAPQSQPGQPGQQDQPWSQPQQPDGQQSPPQWNQPGQGQQPPQNPGW